MELYYALKTVELHDLFIELDEKSEKKCKKSVDVRLYAMHNTGMSGPHSKDKKQISVWIPIVLFTKFQKRAKALGMSMSEIITAFLLQQTKNIELTVEEYERITEEIRKKTSKY